MFDLGFEKIVVLLVAALFILGPERLPGAAASLGRAIRKVKEFTAEAGRQVRDEVGPDLDELRAPLAELRAPLQELRALRDPRRALVKHLLDDPPAAAAAHATAPTER
ncbi:MAG: twin-arginine translocase TatA/TatE family subunit [Pseudonocardia sp.]|uniref:twin-arginine translocase TatA/TatE family subunit n=1 Tax=unclassified Pseudonocardia TaxID=2619320 RepID=UPI00086EB562|nr:MULTISPECIES: twin-arginine translocase TatA/TatE family subunit [unclassified Pseudonocardia]MBN9113672.1 twin-arginine translocase TatA/TatE family subunit [Pseudonocardia sp.]ODU28829.1 MAG: hypothetical protein ABS80_02265 [Pseudonocardia sp. SCN 72-51]ODU98948.1 MAG: hypothetical protein ABT15_32835 [Pseudonocardia sp. SCN 73-27]